MIKNQLIFQPIRDIIDVYTKKREVKCMSKSTGIKREIDKLGRIVLPIELRRTLEIESGDSVEIYVEDNRVILEKYRPSCIFCSGSEGISQYKGKNVCAGCIAELKKAEQAKAL